MDNKISSKQLEANRKNAKLGGVKTPEGKAISKYNAVTHGILRQSLTDYEKEIYKDYLKELIDEYNPATFTDKFLVERAALCYVRLFRSAKAEQEQIREELDPTVTKGIFPDLNEFEVIKEGYKPKLSSLRLEIIEKTILRYERHAEKTLFRVLHELERRMVARGGKKAIPPLAIDVDVSK